MILFLKKNFMRKKYIKGAIWTFATKLQKPFRNFATEIEKGTECSWLYRTKSIANYGRNEKFSRTSS